MLTTLRREYALLITSGAQLLLIFIAIKFNVHIVWQASFGLVAFISLFAWMSALRRLRMVRDTPTSRIASAAQGYVELTGRGRPLPGTTLISKHYGLPCLWYRYKIQRRTGDSRELEMVDEGESTEPFLIDDGSGSCVIDPAGAEILTQHHESWWRDDYLYTEWKLLDIDTLYAIGQFRTCGGNTVETNINEEMKSVLAEWKENMPELHKRFDLNGDGELDMQEWMLARKAARREAEKRMDALHAEPDTHYLLQPKDGRLFLISNMPQEKLANRYWFWVWAHLVIFFGALGAFGFLLGHKTI